MRSALESSINLNSLSSSNSSGSTPNPTNIFSGPGGCNGGSILVKETIVLSFKCHSIASNAYRTILCDLIFFRSS